MNDECKMMKNQKSDKKKEFEKRFLIIHHSSFLFNWTSQKFLIGNR
jgi:hypothetical protein